MHTLLDENFWDGILFEEQFEMQATMFQPVGGMDRIPYAFAKALGEISAIRIARNRDTKDGEGCADWLHAGWTAQID